MLDIPRDSYQYDNALLHLEKENPSAFEELASLPSAVKKHNENVESAMTETVTTVCGKLEDFQPTLDGTGGGLRQNITGF